MKLVYISFFLFGLLTSCQPKENQNKFEWNAGFSAPKNYIAGGPYVEFFYKGKSIAGNSSNVGINPGWGRTSGGISGGEIFKPIPDSVFVKWRCGFDLIEYEGGIKLSRKKMLELFKKKAVDVYGEKVGYSVIIVGMAPGGNTTIWMQAGSVITEIQKFKAQKKEKIDPYDPTTITLWTSKGQEAKDILKYISLHGVPYSVWEKGDKEYNYDIGFSSEDGKIEISDTTIFYCKDGSLFQSNGYSNFVTIDWNILENGSKDTVVKKKLPVQILVDIGDYRKKFYRTNIVLPQNFEQIFTKTYLDSITGKKQHYTRIVIGVKKDLEKGIIWLEGKRKRKKIMTFKIYPAQENKDGSFKTGGYSLPKGFVFPKWEGREKLTFPELDYWQEK